MSLPPKGGEKIKLWGLLNYRYWEKKGDYCHSLKAVYYERIPAVRSPLHSRGHSVQQHRSVGQNMKITGTYVHVYWSVNVTVVHVYIIG